MNKHTPKSPLVAVTVIMALLIPLIPTLPQVFNLSGRAPGMTSMSVYKEAFSICFFYLGLFAYFMSAISISKNKIKATNALLLLSVCMLLVSAAIEIFGLANNATYNPSQVFISALLPLLTVAYVNKRTGLKAWTPSYTWAIVLMIALCIAFIWLGTKIGWNKYSEMFGVNFSEKSYAVVDSGTILTSLLGLIVLTVGVGIAKRLTKGLNITSWIGIILMVVLPLLYAFFHKDSKTALIQVMGWWPFWTAAAALYVFAIAGFMTGPWNKDFVLPKGDEQHVDEESAAHSNWNNY